MGLRCNRVKKMDRLCLSAVRKDLSNGEKQNTKSFRYTRRTYGGLASPTYGWLHCP